VVIGRNHIFQILIRGFGFSIRAAQTILLAEFLLKSYAQGKDFMEWVFHLDWPQVTATSLLTLALITIGRYLIGPYLGSYIKKKGENLATIEDIDRINLKLEEIRQGFLKSNAYLTEKGKNEATKEDINELTSMIESIKSQYTATLEVLRFELSKQAQVHRLAAEKEFQALAEIGEALYDLEHDTRALRSTFLLLTGGNNMESEQARWQSWQRSHNKYLNIINRNRLFLPTNICQQLQSIFGTANREAALFEAESQMGNRWQNLEGRDNLITEMSARIQDLLHTIRQRYGIAD
jgi:hypothetical protein